MHGLYSCTPQNINPQRLTPCKFLNFPLLKKQTNKKQKTPTPTMAYNRQFQPYQVSNYKQFINNISKGSMSICNSKVLNYSAQNLITQQVFCKKNIEQSFRLIFYYWTTRLKDTPSGKIPANKMLPKKANRKTQK